MKDTADPLIQVKIRILNAKQFGWGVNLKSHNAGD